MCVCTHHSDGPVEPASSLSYLLPAGLRGARLAGDARPGRGEEAGSPFDSKAQFAFQLKEKKMDGCHVARVTAGAAAAAVWLR